MRATLVQAGERLVVSCAERWVARVLAEACPDAWHPVGSTVPDIEVFVSTERAPMDLTGAEPLTRGAWLRRGDVLLTNAAGSGFDLGVRVEGDRLRVEARWRPPLREHAAAYALRSRFHLLARAALVQYPALWWSGRRGRAPLHAAAVTVGDATCLLAGPGGIGRSTLLLQAVAAGEHACSDNLCVSDGVWTHGLVEPVRVEGGGGRRMAYGRSERALPGRVDALRPDRLVVLRRSNAAWPVVNPLEPTAAARAITAGTYMAGELRRYWAFAAALALGTGIGPSHPEVAETSAELAARLPAYEIVLGAAPSAGLAELLSHASAVML
ncbi:hypothetical protein [Streptacidiphilus jiangxiensis]|uniref:Uncharacterized protein n=1 Tax=Streptacidiphilus jiangxiensis TaxID=235985 RepID=A0A1H7QP17_STRJI|nr:hypothetical protein [Streptacidiphilus jiangxiensis]SEL49663.1 hypothetical protein SAMN05414137_109136 [Streptacidiphilus jiangxiensis]